MLCPDSNWGRHSISKKRWPLLCLEAYYRFLNHLLWDKPSVAWPGLRCQEEFPGRAAPSGWNNETDAFSSDNSFKHIASMRQSLRLALAFKCSLETHASRLRVIKMSCGSIKRLQWQNRCFFQTFISEACRCFCPKCPTHLSEVANLWWEGDESNTKFPRRHERTTRTYNTRRCDYFWLHVWRRHVKQNERENKWQRLTSQSAFAERSLDMWYLLELKCFAIQSGCQVYLRVH